MGKLSNIIDSQKIKNIDIIISKNITHIKEKDIYYFKASDIGKLLKLTNIRVSIQNFSKYEKIIKKSKDNKGIEQNTTFLTIEGVYKLLCLSRKQESQQLCKDLSIDSKIKYIPQEMTFVEQIKRAFNGEIISLQYTVLNYNVDLYFNEYKLVVEFDEHKHKFTIDKDLIRQNKIQNELKCTFIRVKEDECVFDAINKIYKHVRYLNAYQNWRKI